MTRRELFKTLTASTAAANIAVEPTETGLSVVEASTTKPALIIVECPGSISQQAAERLRSYISLALETTPFKGLATLILADGMRATFLDATGRPLNVQIPDA